MTLMSAPNFSCDEYNCKNEPAYIMQNFSRFLNIYNTCRCLPPSWSLTCFTSAEAFFAGMDKNSNASNDFGVVIVDHFLGENRMLGTALVDLLRGQYLYKGLIIGCSGDDRHQEYLAAGANLFWGKPAPQNEHILQSFIDYQALLV